jgi:hypothetical protein
MRSGAPVLNGKRIAWMGMDLENTRCASSKCQQSAILRNPANLTRQPRLSFTSCRHFANTIHGSRNRSLRNPRHPGNVLSLGRPDISSRRRADVLTKPTQGIEAIFPIASLLIGRRLPSLAIESNELPHRRRPDITNKPLMFLPIWRATARSPTPSPLHGIPLR